MAAAAGLVLASLFAHAEAAPPDAKADHPPFARAPAAVITLWPVELPCAQPRRLWAQAAWGTAFAWSSGDGGETRSFTLSLDVHKNHETRLPRTFPTGRLTRLISQTPSGDPSRDRVAVNCANGGEVMWGPCPGGACAVSATYPGQALPTSKQRTRRWTDEIPGSPWADAAPDVHWTRFHRDIARKPAGHAAPVRESLRFSRAYAIELRDLLAGACRTQRCSPPAREASAKLAAYLGDRSPGYSNPSARTLDPWCYEWAWTATAGGVSLAVSCVDMKESPNLLCRLSFELDGGAVGTAGAQPRARIVYSTFHREVELYAASDVKETTPVGRILHAADDHPPAITAIDGQLLNLRPTSPPAN